MDLRNHYSHGVPFNLQFPNSFRDPTQANVPIKALARLGRFQDARNIALRFIHDDQIFAAVWNSNRISTQTRRYLRILVQIQTVNAVMNRYEHQIRTTLFFLKDTSVSSIDFIDCLMGEKLGLITR